MNCRVQLIGFGFSTQKDLERGYCRLGHGSRRAAPIFKAVDPASVAIERDLFSYEGCPLAGSPLGDALENTVGTEGQGGQKQVGPPVGSKYATQSSWMTWHNQLRRGRTACRPFGECRLPCFALYTRAMLPPFSAEPLIPVLVTRERNARRIADTTLLRPHRHYAPRQLHGQAIELVSAVPFHSLGSPAARRPERGCSVTVPCRMQASKTAFPWALRLTFCLRLSGQVRLSVLKVPTAYHRFR